MEKEEIRKGIIAMLSGEKPLNSTWCICKSVSAQECTITIDDLDIEGILLGFDKSGVIVYPKPNTEVLVLFVDNTNTNGTVVLVKETDKIEIMGSNYKGLPILDEINKNLDAIKDYLDAQKTAIGNAFTAVGASTAANGANGKVSFDAEMAAQVITFSDMENKKVTHGNG